MKYIFVLTIALITTLSAQAMEMKDDMMMKKDHMMTGAMMDKTMDDGMIKKDMMKDEMMKKDMMKDTMMEKKMMMKEKLMMKVKNLSPEKITKLLAKIETLKTKIMSSNIDETKKMKHLETLEMLKEVLMGDEMMK